MEFIVSTVTVLSNPEITLPRLESLIAWPVTTLASATWFNRLIRPSVGKMALLPSSELAMVYISSDDSSKALLATSTPRTAASPPTKSSDPKRFINEFISFSTVFLRVALALLAISSGPEYIFLISDFKADKNSSDVLAAWPSGKPASRRRLR